MYKDYIQSYKHHEHTYGPNTVIFMLVGSFYELYDVPDAATGEGKTSMRRAVEVLGIQLKVKKGDAPGGVDGWFAGFPESQLHKFAALLTRENWTVVVVGQEKDSKGKVTGRSVARILSPGTHVEAAGGTADAVYLGVLWLSAEGWSEGSVAAPPAFGAAAIDLTTGSVATYEGVATGRRDVWSSDELLHFFQVHPPREMNVWWQGYAMDAPDQGTLRRTLGVPGALLSLRQAGDLGPAVEKAIVREDLLRRYFQPRGLLPLRAALGLTETPQTERALCAALLFLQDHFPSAAEQLHAPVAWNPADSMILGNHALTQLNIITPREEDSVLGLFLRTYTRMGRRAMRQRLLTPVCVEERLEKWYEEIAWFQGAERADALSPLRQIQDLSRLHRRLATGSINAADILALDMSYGCVDRLAEALAASPQPMGPAMASSFAEFRAAFLATFSVEKALVASEDAFCMTEDAGPRTAAVEREIAATREAMDSLYGALVEWFGETRETLRMELKEATVSLVGGKGVMTRAQDRLKKTASSAPPGGAITVHAKKASSSMEVSGLNGLYHKLLRLREELQRVVRDELPVACEALANIHLPTWTALEEWVAAADVAATLARVAEERGFCRPVLMGTLQGCDSNGPATGSAVHLEGLAHPLIEGQATRTEYVRHRVQLGEATEGWLVYGMNASGKSSLMKAVGIAVLLAQCGSYVPATAMRLVPFRALFTRILNTDNLWAGLSSFAVEMTELSEILRRADARSLVLGDEVCSGTESESATALVAATLEHFAARGVRYIFATHLHGLQAVPVVTGLRGLQVWHLRVRYDAAADRLIYERTLQPGAGSSLYGLEVAKAMGLPAAVLESAQRIRRAIAGATTDGEAAASTWNSAVHRRTCEVCGTGLTRDLEVHHIQQRAAATGAGRLADGSHMNDLRNLVVVCQICHDKHHAGQMHIGSVKQTSEGPMRDVLDLSAYAFKGAAAAAVPPQAKGLTEEQLATVQIYLRKYPTCPPKRLVYDLAEKEGITITIPRLAKVREGLGTRSQG